MQRTLLFMVPVSVIVHQSIANQLNAVRLNLGSSCIRVPYVQDGQLFKHSKELMRPHDLLEDLKRFHVIMACGKKPVISI